MEILIKSGKSDGTKNLPQNLIFESKKTLQFDVIFQTRIIQSTFQMSKVYTFGLQR